MEARTPHNGARTPPTWLGVSPTYLAWLQDPLGQHPPQLIAKILEPSS